MPERPNILVIITDQQNSSMMGCAGNRFAATPAMDSIARSGTRFTRAYCTNPVCVASRFSLMTGRMPHELGMLSNSTADIGKIPSAIKENGLGFLMRKAGYDTLFAGKVHLPEMSPEDVGFEHICADARDALADACSAALLERRSRPLCMVAAFTNPHDICYMAIRDFAKDADAQKIIKKGAAAIAGLDAALARPCGVGDEEFFSDHCPPLPSNFEIQEREPEAVSMLLRARPFRMAARENWRENRWREHRWAYARLVESVDRQIGRILKALSESGRDARTLVVFTSDHGDMDASHRLEHKSVLYEEAIRIPLLIRPPAGGPAPQPVKESLVSNGLDLLPTLCDYAGAPAPGGLPGRSLRPLIEGGAGAWRKSLPVECVIGRSIMTESFKYAEYFTGKNAEQLTDLHHDPFELRNAIDDPSHAEKLVELRAAFRAAYGGERPDTSRLAAAMLHA